MIKVNTLLQTKGIVFQGKSTSPRLTEDEVDAAWAFVLENCAWSAAMPPKPIFWTRLKEN